MKTLITTIKSRAEFLLALFAWLFVFGYTINAWLNLPHPTVLKPSPISLTLVIASFFLFLCFLLYFEFFRVKLSKYQSAILIFSLLNIVFLMTLFHVGFTAILLIIFLVKLTDFEPSKAILYGIILLPLAIALLNMVVFNPPHILLNGLAFTLYNTFAYQFAMRVISERKAKEQSAHFLRELTATQTLLNDAATRDERIRIARDLHDTLGHHLTGLSIQLEVANHCQLEQSRVHITKAQQITRLLLADVRESVNAMRTDQSLNLFASLHALCQSIPRLDVQLDYDKSIKVSDTIVAQTVFHSVQEAITNCLKHSNASRLSVSVGRKHNQLHLVIKDNGRMTKHYHLGNGLQGMQERLKLLKGCIEFKHSDDGFSIIAQMPEQLKLA